MSTQATDKKDLIDRIEGALEEMRPFFEADGGDMKLLEVTSDFVVKLGLVGACSSCSMSQMSLKAGEKAIQDVAPEVVRVEAVRLEESYA